MRDKVTPLGNVVYAYSIPNIINKCRTAGNKNLKLEDALIWARGFPMHTFQSTPSDRRQLQFYGNVLIATGATGCTHFINPKDGTDIQQLYSVEGASVCPIIADGIIYTYGAQNRLPITWGPAKVAHNFMMYTPYGK
jgi:hypothetical protein